MSDSTNDAARIEAMGRRVAEQLQSVFAHSAEEAQRRFAEFHESTKHSREWADADYYDHEGALGVALEVEFARRFGLSVDRHEFVNWRRDIVAAWNVRRSSQ